MITEARNRRQQRVVTCYLLLCHMSLISSVQSSPAKTALIGVISLELRSNCGGLCIVDEAEPHWELFQWLIIFQSDLFYYLFTFLKTHFTGSETRTADMNIGTGAGCGGHTSAWKSSIRRFVITEKVPTRAFSCLKAPSSAFTFNLESIKTLC